MKTSKSSFLLWLATASVFIGCQSPRGKPGPEPEVPRPEQVLDFATLYKGNCIACHGDNHQPGAAISLANPVFLAVAGEANLKNAIANRVSGKLMPAFGKGAGGMLTDQQVELLTKGLINNWGQSAMLAGQNPPPYKATLVANSAAGQQVYATNCARCHGANGEGDPSAKSAQGSIVDASYLALISDQELRNFTIAGAPGMPDWRGDKSASRPISDQEVTNVVAWLASHRLGSSVVTTPATPPQEPHS